MQGLIQQNSSTTSVRIADGRRRAPLNMLRGGPSDLLMWPGSIVPWTPDRNRASLWEIGGSGGLYWTAKSLRLSTYLGGILDRPSTIPGA